jgi:hypothetical protein
MNKEKSNKKEKKGILLITINIENNSIELLPDINSTTTITTC